MRVNKFVLDANIWVSYIIKEKQVALQTNSGYVTSGDSHILEAKARLEKRYSKLHILTKKEFEKMFA